MWYLIRRKQDSKITLRYYSHTSQPPNLLFRNRYHFNWTGSIHDFSYLTTEKPQSGYETIDALQSDGRFTIIPLPKLPRYISSVNNVNSAYPELFL